jgi:hypothetical protein
MTAPGRGWLDGQHASEFALLASFLFGTANGQESITLAGGIVLKAGNSVVQDNTGLSRVTFADPFPTACRRVIACNDSGGGIPSAWAGCGNWDRFGATIGHARASLTAAEAGAAAHWIAIGY